MKLIGITGGKGGTGKSTVATSLATRLSKNNRVLLVDADVDCPNDHLLLNIELNKTMSVNQRIPKWDFDKCTKCGKCGAVCNENAIIAIKERLPIFEKSQCNGCGACEFVCPTKAITWDEKEIGAIYEGKLEKPNMDLLSGELNANEPISELIVNRLNELIEEKMTDYDYIVIDTAAGTHCPVIAALELCDYVFAVTEPTPLGVHDLELILKLIKVLDKNANIVINRSDIGDEAPTHELAKKYDMSVLCNIPFSMEIVKNYANGIPIEHPAIEQLVEEIVK